MGMGDIIASSSRLDQLVPPLYSHPVMNAVFAGTFDPPTLGHLDVMRRGAAVFKLLRVVVAHNVSKQSLFTVEERMAMLEGLVREEGFENVVVDSWDGLVAVYARAHGCGVLLRSFRSMSEIPYEQTMATMSSRIDPAIETMFFLSKPEYQDISSSAVRELVTWKRLPKGVVPGLVEKELEKRHGPLLQV